jgi:ParB/RepB/Spo0J family partition protein
MSAATLAARVKTRREELGLSQRALPGIDQGLLSRIESGKTKDPGLEVLRNLGKALNLSLDELDGAPASAVRMVELKHLAVDHDNPRKIRPDSAEDQSLVESIRTLGLLQPLAVRDVAAVPTEPVWMVVDGHRRYAALAVIHGPKSKTLVPCRIVKADDSQKLLMQLVANVQRADMNPLDLAKAVGQLIDGGMGTQVVGDAIGRKRRWVQEQASIARQFHPEAGVALQSGQISISQAVAIAARKEKPEQQRATLQRVVEQALNEDDIRALTATEREEESDQQLDLVDQLAPPAQAERKAPVAASGWKTWRDAKGYLKWRMMKFAESGEFVVEHTVQWRREGYTATHFSVMRPMPSQAEALAHAVARGSSSGDAWSEIVHRASASDKGVLSSLLSWIVKGLRRLDGDDDLVAKVQRELEGRLLEKFRPVGPPSKRKVKAAPAPEPPSVDELGRLPRWANQLAGALFVVMDETDDQALLCHGWTAMVHVLATVELEEIRELHDRKAWRSDAGGKPFSYAELVYIVTEAKP